MASLRAFLPPAGSTVWRSERSSTRTSSNGEVEYSLSRTRIKHIVIREVWKKTVPSLHALYKVDVMTQSNHWFILRRYREFYTLHQNLVKHYGIPTDMLPSKKLSSNMSLIHLDRRRNALEHYLQRLINSHHDIAESNELFQFLNVQTHDVLCVTRQLAKVLEKEGRNVLASGGMFTFTPTQMYCITRQLQLPHFVVEEPSEDEESADLGYLYGFIQELKSLCVSGLPSRSSPCQELISNQAFDISLFKSLEKLQIDNCHISVIEGLFRIQKQLTHVTLRNSLKTMKQFIVDCATQKRTVNQANNSVESWRSHSTTKLTENRVVVRPWIHLTHINMSHNKISALDHSLKLLPALEQLDLSHNEFIHLDLKQLTSSTLTFLNISHNNIRYISATAKDLRNLKSFLLSHNRLQCLDGLDCLRGLVELDIRHNEIKIIEELVKISSLLHLRILALTGNPCVASKSYRIHVFIQLKTRELILDGVKITENEKAKVHEHQERKTKDVGIQSPEASVSAAQQPSSRAMRRKITKSDRDDDQDSGFGGNYGGSIDEGGLVFDWCCYGNYAEMTTTAQDDQGAGPSTSWHDLTSSTERNNDILVSNSQVSRSNILGNSPLKEGRTGKGKAPLRLKRLEHSENVSPKRSTSKGRQRQPNVVADEMQGMHRDFQGTVVTEEDVLYEGNDAVCNKLQSESSDSKESCGKESGHLVIGEIPFGPHTETSERSNVGSLPSLTVVGESSSDVAVDVNTQSSVLIETSPPSTVYDINSESSKITEEPLSDEVGCTSRSSSFCEQSYRATVLQEEAECSPPEKLSVGTGCETNKKSDSFATEPLSYKLQDVHLIPPCEELSPAAGCVSKTSCSNNAESFSYKLDVWPSSSEEEYSSAVSGDTDEKSCSIAGEPLSHVVKDIHPFSPNEEPYFSISGDTDNTKSYSVAGEPLLHVVKDIEPTKESSLSAGCDINHTSCLIPGESFSNIPEDVQHISSDDESSPDKQLSSVPVCEDEDETCSFSTENSFAFTSVPDANYCSVAQESSDVLNDILKISSLLDKHSLPNPGSDE